MRSSRFKAYIARLGAERVSGRRALRIGHLSADDRLLVLQVWQAISRLQTRRFACPNLRGGSRAGSWKQCVRMLPISHGNQRTRGRMHSKARSSTLHRQSHASTGPSVLQYSRWLLLMAYTDQTSRASPDACTDRAQAQILVGMVQSLSDAASIPKTSPSMHPVERAVHPAERAVRERNEGAGLSRPCLINLPKREGMVTRGARRANPCSRPSTTTAPWTARPTSRNKSQIMRI